MSEWFRIIAFCILASITYGVVHDMVTAHICVEYFTIAHPPVVDSTSPVVLALVWGVLATWWVGLALGVVLASVARFGTRRPVVLAQLTSPIVNVMLVSALAAFAAGCVGAVLHAVDIIHIGLSWESRIAPERHGRFLAVAWAHTASYIVGALAGLALIIRTWRRRVAK